MSASAPTTFDWLDRAAALLLIAAAAAAAGYGQAIVGNDPTLSLKAFALGVLLVVVAERLLPVPLEPADAAPDVPASRPWWLLGGGVLLCLAAAVAANLETWPHLTVGLWLVGLALFVGAALRSWWNGAPMPRPPARFFVVLLVLLVVAGGFFGWHLTSVPPEVHGDEAEVGNDAVRLLTETPFNLFTAGWYELPMFHCLPSAVGLKIFGVNLLGLRSPSWTFGVLSVLLLFAVAHRLWGFEVALLAALLLASTRFFIHLSRTGYHYIDTPFISLLAVWLFLRIWRDLRLPAAIGCGILLGVGIQTYYASRLVPVLLTLTLLCWLIGSERVLLRRRLVCFAVIIIVALATSAPMFGYFLNHWDWLWARTRGTSIFNAGAIEHLSHGYNTHDFSKILAIQLKKASGLFNITVDTSRQYGYQFGGMLEPVSGALLVLGLGLVCLRAGQRRNQLLLLWVLIPSIAGAALTIDAPFFPRVSGAVPFAMVMIALALHTGLNGIRAVIPGAAGRVVAVVVAAGVLAAIFTNNIRTYFIDYAPNFRHGPAVELAAWIREHGKDKTSYMVGGAPGFYIKHGTIRFLAYGYDMRDIIEIEPFLRENRLDPMHDVFVIMPPLQRLTRCGAPSCGDLGQQLTDAVGPLDVQEYRNIRHEVSFYGAIPRAQLNGAP